MSHFSHKHHLKQADDKMYSLTYEPLDTEGKVITEPTNGQTEW